MIEYGTFGATVNFQDYQTTLNNGAVLTTINSISGNVNYLQENYSYTFITEISGNTTAFFDTNYGFIETQVPGVSGYRMVYSPGNFSFIYTDTVSGYFYGYFQYQTTNIKIGSNIGIIPTYIELDNTLPGVEKINMFIGTGPIRYLTDEFRYVSTTPGSLIQGTKGAPQGFLIIRSATQQYKIRLYAP